MQPNSGPRRKLRIFAGSAVATAIALVLTGWLTGIREVMHGALLALAIAAFFPFVLVAAGLVLGLGAGVLVILLGVFAGGDLGPLPADGMAPVLEGGAWLVPRYYKFWARRRHPGLWGASFGILAGCLLLAGLIVTLVLPGEATTIRSLAEAQRRIDAYYKQQGRYPDPDARGQLTEFAFGGGPRMRDETIRDGFGRPFLYQVSGRGRFASYSVKSLGFDGRPGRDDLCVSGLTRFMGWADVAGNLARHVALKNGATGEAVLNKLKGIRALRCE